MPRVANSGWWKRLQRLQWAFSLLTVLVAAPTFAQQLELVSVSASDPTRTASDYSAGGNPPISADGRFVAFESNATDLVPGQQTTFGTRNVFLRDRLTGTTALVSHTSSPVTGGNGYSLGPALSADGNWVAFMSSATNLGNGFTAGGLPQVYLWERATGNISLVSHAASPTAASGGNCMWLSISADGAFVALSCQASDLGSGFTDGNAAEDVFLYETATGTISLVSHTASPTTAGNDSSTIPHVSANGYWVLFTSRATDLGSSGYADGNGSQDLFLYSRLTGEITLVSHSADPNTTASGVSDWGEIDDAGDFVVFESQAPDVGSGIVDTNSAMDVFLWARATGAITLLSHAAAANVAAAGTSGCPVISHDGDWAAFCSNASNVGGSFTDTNGKNDAFLWQRATGTISLVSYGSSAITTANGDSVARAIGGSGDYVVFESSATNLGGVAWTDTNGTFDAFVYRRVPATITLASRRASLPTTTGNNEAYAYGAVMNRDIANGTYVVFGSTATNVGFLDFNGYMDVYVLANPTCTAPVLSAAEAGPNQVTLSWPSAVGPLLVRRSRTAGGPYETLATVDTTSYVDATAQRGVTYHYVVQNLCGVSNEASASTTTGLCELPPDFDPATGVGEESGATCALRVGWMPASAPCGGSISYSLYRSTDAAFVPSGRNRIATGLTGLDYLDTTALFAQTYYYIVRATDGGNLLEDGNTVLASRAAWACTDAVPAPVAAVTVRATQGVATQEHALEWVVPPTGQSVYCAGTSGYLTPPDPGCSSHTGVPGSSARIDVSASDSTDSYYTVFAQGTAGYSEARSRSSRSQSTPAQVDWSFTTGASALATPYVRPGVGYYAVSNDRVLYAMAPDTGGGTWPTDWTPFAMNGAVQGRPVVLQLGGFDVYGVHTVAFVGSQDGHVYAIDAASGAELWDRDLGAPVQAAPSIVLKEQGGHYDLVMVGTRNAAGASRFYALKPKTGEVAWMFDNNPGLPIGIISSKAQIDIANDLVYFTSRRYPGGGDASVWCLRFTDTGFTKVWAEGSTIPDVDGSPILRNGKLYVGDNQGIVRALDPLDAAAPQVIYTTADGLPIKGYVVWREGVLYFSSGDRVYAIRDDGTAFWTAPVNVPNASPVLVWAGKVYVGGGNSRLYSIDALAGTSNSIQLGNPAVPKVVGFPTADTVTSHVIVGTDQGDVYLVKLF